jgi:hypothetical protein
MIAALLLLLATLGGSPAGAAPSPEVYQAAPLCAVPAAPEAVAFPSWPPSPAIAPSDVITYYAFLPLVVRKPDVCQPIPGVDYGTLNPTEIVLDPAAEENPDLNLTMRGYEVTVAHQGLVHIDGSPDPGAPQLYTLFADHRVPVFTTVYQVYDWDWPCGCRGGLLTDWEVTLAGMGVTPGEVLHLPDSGYDIGSGYEALVLYATEERITFKYTREDHVVWGYTIHVENVCVEPSLLALYQAWNDAGRGQLPALHGGEPFGRARGTEIGVAVRDTGRIMDRRSRGDWWQGKPLLRGLDQDWLACSCPLVAQKWGLGKTGID